jgi:hypothetical protein
MRLRAAGDSSFASIGKDLPTRFPQLDKRLSKAKDKLVHE